ncbi:MAG: hypothetical protein QXT38_03895, partial [Candidatus Aenigmatarchaeota archaeon]
QKNIYEILNLFNNKFNLQKVFIEGAPKGKFSPVLLTSIPDEKVRKLTIDRLFNKGLLSAAEYFEVIHNTGKVYGVEDWGVYLENYNRLKKLLTLKQQIVPKVEQLNKAVKQLQDKYLSKEIKVFAKKLDRIKEDKFYKIDLIAKSLNISLDFYPETKKYIELVNISKTLKLNRIGRELKEFFVRLQNIVPYGVYTRLQQKLQNQKNIDEYYLALIKVAESYGGDLLKQYPNLVKFFNYIKLNYRINPTLLAQEERLLKHEILVRYARKLIDKEILKLTLNTQSLKNLVNLTIVPEEYEYFVKNKDEYSLLIRKYFGEDFIEILDILEEKDLYKFYDVNLTRNYVFYKNLLDSLITELKSAKQNTTDSQIQTTQSQLESKRLYIFITGGFHTQVTDYFKQLGISYLVIMPNVTKYYYSDKIYEKLALGKVELTDFLKNAFSVLLTQKLRTGEEGSIKVSIETILNALISQGGEVKIEQVQPLLRDWADQLKKDETRSKLKESGVKEKVISEIVEFLEKTDIQKIGDDKYLVKINDESCEVEFEKSGNIKVNKVNNLTKEHRHGISLWNRIVSAAIAVTIPVAIFAGITYIIGHGIIGGPFGFILGLLSAGRFIRQIIYFAKASRTRGEPVVNFERIKENLAKFFPHKLISRLQEGKANRFTPAYTDKENKENIYINTEIFSRLNIFEQYSVIKHELRHLLFLKKHKSLSKIPFLSELFVIFVEIFDNLKSIIYTAFFPKRLTDPASLKQEIRSLTDQFLLPPQLFKIKNKLEKLILKGPRDISFLISMFKYKLDLFAPWFLLGKFGKEKGYNSIGGHLAFINIYLRGAIKRLADEREKRDEIKFDLKNESGETIISGEKTIKEWQKELERIKKEINKWKKGINSLVISEEVKKRLREAEEKYKLLENAIINERIRIQNEEMQKVLNLINSINTEVLESEDLLQQVNTKKLEVEAEIRNLVSKISKQLEQKKEELQKIGLFTQDVTNWIDRLNALSQKPILEDDVNELIEIIEKINSFIKTNLTGNKAEELSKNYGKNKEYYETLLMSEELKDLGLAIKNRAYFKGIDDIFDKIKELVKDSTENRLIIDGYLTPRRYVIYKILVELTRLVMAFLTTFVSFKISFVLSIPILGATSLGAIIIGILIFLFHYYIFWPVAHKIILFLMDIFSVPLSKIGLVKPPVGQEMLSMDELKQKLEEYKKQKGVPYTLVVPIPCRSVEGDAGFYVKKEVEALKPTLDFLGDNFRIVFVFLTSEGLPAEQERQK